MSWEFGGGNIPGQILVGQVTKCEVEVDGQATIFYVRENMDGRQSFFTTGNERIAIKGGERGPRMSRQILDLAAPANYWEQISEIVRQADPHGRGVRRHRLFSAKWAEERLRRPAG